MGQGDGRWAMGEWEMEDGGLHVCRQNRLVSFSHTDVSRQRQLRTDIERRQKGSG